MQDLDANPFYSVRMYANTHTGSFPFLIHTVASARCQHAAIDSNRSNGLRVLSGSFIETVKRVTIYLSNECPICFSLSSGFGNSESARLRVVSLLEYCETRRQAEAYRTLILTRHFDEWLTFATHPRRSSKWFKSTASLKLVRTMLPQRQEWQRR